LTFVTYTFVPSDETATPRGFFPTGTVAVTVFELVLITETVLLLKFVIYAYEGAGIPFGTTFTVASFVSVPFGLLTFRVTV